MAAVVAVHALVPLSLPAHAAVTASRGLTSILGVLAAICILTRILHLPRRERPYWSWAAAGVLLWSAAVGVEALVGRTAQASSDMVDASDFLYFGAQFALLMVFSTTRETEKLRIVFLLNCVQVGLAGVLSYTLLYQTPMPLDTTSALLGRIYTVTSALLAIMSILRSLSWASEEERRCVRWISIVLWTYLPIEAAMDYATAHYHLRAGTLLDLAWSIPFALAGWQAISLPLPDRVGSARRNLTRFRLLIDAACPLLMNLGIFGLAALLYSTHPQLALGSVFFVLILQGTQAVVMQMNYLAGRNLLLSQSQHLRHANAALEELTLLDPLTGIANRRRFNASLEEAWRNASWRGASLALLMIDLDFFKGVNDLHGHTYGDECLIRAARLMTEQARRPNDLVARLGGEEFVLLLPDTNEAGARRVAQRIQDAICDAGLANYASPFERRLTASIGAAVGVANASTDPHILINAADKALYEAKTSGRNRTCLRMAGAAEATSIG